jgi:NADH dehydrogenase
MTTHTIAILGGSGFVGSRLCARLARDGHTLRVLTRRRERHRDLLVLPTVEVWEGNPHDAAVLDALLAGCDVVINLVGILNERQHDGSGFAHAHVELSRTVIAACRRHGIRRLLHMSALGADAEHGASHYQRSKGRGEDLALAASDLDVTVFRPSVIFGPGDSFLRRFAGLLRLAPVFPLACVGARFQPVFVGDVAECFARAIDNPQTIGQRYNLCGPCDYTLLELVRYTARVSGMRRLIIPLPDTLSRLQAEIFEWLPGKPFSRDNYLSTRHDNVCHAPFPEIFGITPTPLEAVAPYYLGQAGERRRYERLRSRD